MKAIIIAIHKDYIFNVERPLSLVKLYSVPLIVRMIYSLKSAGITDILILIEFEGKQILELIGDGRDIGMEIQYIEYSADADISPTIPDRFLKEDLLIVYDNVVFDTEFVRIAIETMGSSTFYLEGKPIGVYKLDRELLMNICMKYHCMYVRELLHYIEKSSDLAIIDVSTYLVESVELKRKVTPICIKIIDKDSLKYAKKAIISRIQKGLHFTAYINKPLEDYIVYRIGDIPWITPNRITIFANIAAFIVAMLFLYWDLLPTSILAYLVGIVDGIDGKLARARGITTKLGYIEHSLDMLYEQLWYACFSIRLAQLGYGYPALILSLMVLALDGFVRHCYMQFKQTMGKALTSYTQFDRLFAKIDGRRNIYVLYMIAFTMFSTPIYAIHAIFIHSSLTALVYIIRAIQHMNAADEVENVKSFLKFVGKP